jgi:hypothetical protein
LHKDLTRMNVRAESANQTVQASLFVYQTPYH